MADPPRSEVIFRWGAKPRVPERRRTLILLSTLAEFSYYSQIAAASLPSMANLSMKARNSSTDAISNFEVS
jgi:hypothetical protein